MYSQKYIFQIALKCERKTKKTFFFKIKKKKSGRARFSGTGGDDHKFFLCGLILSFVIFMLTKTWGSYLW
jgi:hypothetical protein